MTDGPGKTILLVEDEALIALAKRTELQACGYRVALAHSGEGAVRAFRDDASIDLILMDIDLGAGMDGTEAARIILAERGVPVVFLSSHTDPETVHKTERIASYGYVAKSSAITVLDASIKMAFKLFEASRLLAESEGKFTKIFMSSPYPMMMIDMLSGTFADVNDAMARDTGYTREELIGRNGLEMGLIEAEVEAETRRLLMGAGSYSDLEVSIRAKSGARRIGLASGHVVSVNSRAYIVQSVLDITERKAAEEEIARRDLFLRSVIEGVSGAIYAKDAGGRYSAINEAGARMLGRRRAEVIGRLDSELMAPDTAAEFRRDDEFVMASGRVYEHEEKLLIEGEPRVYLSAKRPWTDAAGESLGVIGMSMDITARKLAEEGLRESEERFRTIIENSGEGIGIMDGDERFIFANRAAEAIFGVGPGELAGARLDRFVSEEEFRSVLEETALRKRGERSVYELEIRRPDGARRELIVTAVPRVDGGGGYQGTFGVFRDISDRKLAEQRIQALLEEKDLILKEVHHRIKNNLGMIKSFLYLQARGVRNEAAAASLRDAEARVQSMMLLYDRLYRSEDRGSASLAEYLGSLAEEVVGNFAGGASIAIDTAIEDAIVEAKRLIPLGIIVNELLTNSMKYAFAGRDNGRIGLSATRSGGRIALAVSDDGPGIPPGVGFESSTGFGLTLAGMLAKQLEGRIRIERGAGTRVVLEFDA